LSDTEKLHAKFMIYAEPKQNNFNAKVHTLHILWWKISTSYAKSRNCKRKDFFHFQNRV